MQKVKKLQKKISISSKEDPKEKYSDKFIRIILNKQ